jgi:uncharacterized protein YdeI (YjbR/CyaY-like superfamily)
MNPKVDFYFLKASKWQEAYNILRSIVLECGLDEELKWGCPCYTLEGKNVVLIHGFKEYCALLFIKGALLKDDKNILIQQTENVQLPRQLRYTNTTEIKTLAKTIKAYIKEAIELERSGVTTPIAEKKLIQLAIEFQNLINQNETIKIAFMNLTPGRQRAYNLFFTGAKLAATRIARIEKCLPQILEGKGLNE